MDLETFLKRNGIDVNEFLQKINEEELLIYEDYDNKVARFAMYGDYQEGAVDISKVVGIPRHIAETKKVVENFSIFFSPYGDNYHSRANGMLEYDSVEVMEKLKLSFKKEPVRMYKIKDKYFISSNGNHRFHLLKMHYLMSSFKGEDVDGKYVVPALVQELDYVKTYVNFISSLLWDESFYMSSEYDKYYDKTGRTVVTYKDETMVLNDEELLSFLRERLDALMSLDESYYIDTISSMWHKCRWENTGLFKEFISEYFPEMVNVMEVSDYALLEQEIRNSLMEGVHYGNS